MASEKQVSFINSLIEKMHIENHPMRHLSEAQQRLEIIRMLDLENVDVTDEMSDEEVQAAFDEAERRVANMSYGDVLALYQAKWDELNTYDWASVDSRTASQAIGRLKQYQFPEF